MNYGGLRMQKQLFGSDRNIGKQIILGIILIALLMQRFKKRVILIRPESTIQ